MKIDIYSEHTKRLLFSLFHSTKQKKTNSFRRHQHPELELGIMLEGSGNYILEGRTYTAEAGDIFLVRPNEQHCVPTIFSSELKSFNVYVTSYFLWNICGEHIEPSRLAMLVGSSGLEHKYTGRCEIISELIGLSETHEAAQKNRHILRFKLLELILSITGEFVEVSSDSRCIRNLLLHQNDIQNAIAFIDQNLTEPITLDDISKSAGLSRSHTSMLFRSITGISPYEYLLLLRIERAVDLLKRSNMTVLEIAHSCGFRNLANFNKSFRKITGMTPSGYRASKR